MPLILSKRRALARRDTPARLAPLEGDEFEGYASLFGVPDGAGDIVERGAFTASLQRRRPPDVRMLYQHSALEPIGIWRDIREDARGLYVRGRLTLDVIRAREVRALMRDGALDGLSIGFRTKRARRDGPYRRLTEIELWEISVVTFPLLAGSLVTAVGEKSQTLTAAIRNAAQAFQPQENCHPRLSAAEQREGKGTQVDRPRSLPAPGFPSPRIADATLGRE